LGSGYGNNLKRGKNMYKKIGIFLIFALFFINNAPIVNAEQFNITNDAYTEQNNPTTTHDNDNLWSSSGFWKRNIYIGFIGLENIESPILYINVGESNIIKIYSLLESFNETTLTYNNKPINDSSYNVCSYTGTGYKNCSLSGLDLSYGILITDNGTDVTMWSSERLGGTLKPYVVYSPIIPTSTTPITTANDLLSVTSNLSNQLINVDSNNDGIVSDIEIKSTGNKFIPILFLLVFIIFLAGTYHKIIGKK